MMKCMESELILLQRERDMRENFNETSFWEMDPITGPMVPHITALGTITGTSTCISYRIGSLSDRMDGSGAYKDKDGVEWRGQFVNGKYNNGRICHVLR